MRRKDVIVAKGLSSNPLNISFRRAIVGDRLKDWLSLVFLVLPIYLKENKGDFIRLLRKKGVFSTQSLYGDIMKKERISRKKIVLDGKDTGEDKDFSMVFNERCDPNI